MNLVFRLRLKSILDVVVMTFRRSRMVEKNLIFSLSCLPRLLVLGECSEYISGVTRKGVGIHNAKEGGVEMVRWQANVEGERSVWFYPGDWARVKNGFDRREGILDDKATS
ncbi:hypothetical protein Tco_1400054 [Tanacetum coccineum]